jgi:hypothetical protein
MPGFKFQKDDRADYCLIVDPRPEGPMVGVFADSPISESVLDCFGRSYIYAGAAPRRQNGRYDIAALKRGEFILAPGLVYRMRSERAKPDMGTLFGALGRMTDGLGSFGWPATQSDADAREARSPIGEAQDDPPSTGIAPKTEGKPLHEVATSIMTILSFALVAHLLLSALHAG